LVWFDLLIHIRTIKAEARINVNNLFAKGLITKIKYLCIIII
jgi:hypothetical protein